MTSSNQKNKILQVLFINIHFFKSCHTKESFIAENIRDIFIGMRKIMMITQHVLLQNKAKHFLNKKIFIEKKIEIILN